MSSNFIVDFCLSQGWSLCVSRTSALSFNRFEFSLLLKRKKSVECPRLDPVWGSLSSAPPLPLLLPPFGGCPSVAVPQGPRCWVRSCLHQALAYTSTVPWDTVVWAQIPYLAAKRWVVSTFDTLGSHLATELSLSSSLGAGNSKDQCWWWG